MISQGFEIDFKTGLFFYQGYPLFEEMETNRKSLEKKWLRNRQNAYYGSLMHFMRSVYRNKIPEEHFEVRRLNREQLNVKSDKLLTGDSIAFGVDSVTAGLAFPGHLQVAKRKPRPLGLGLVQVCVG
jgi:hypothetical protein